MSGATVYQRGALRAAENNPSFSSSGPAGLQLAWDSTSLGELKSCPRKYYYRILMGAVPRETSVHLFFGLGYHAALEVYDKARIAGQSYAEASREAVKSVLDFTWDHKMNRPWLSSDPNKNRETLLRTVVWYLDHFEHDPLETFQLADGRAAVELSCALPLPLRTLSTGEDFILCGHLDKVVRLRDQAEKAYILDRKTTKQTLSKHYFSQFSPHNQFSTYGVLGKLGFELPIGGLFVDAAQVAVNFSRFERVLLTQTQAQHEEWLRELSYWLRQAEQFAEEHYWPMNDKSCLAADTIVTINRGKRKGWKLSIGALHAMLHGKSRANPSIETFALAESNGFVKPLKMYDVVRRGKKPVFLLTTSTGTIKATSDHRFNTPTGWKRLDELKPNDVMLWWGSRKGGLSIEKKLGKSRVTIGRLLYYPAGRYIGTHQGKTQRKARLVVEAEMNGLLLEEFLCILRTDEAAAKKLVYLPARSEVHHIDGDELNDAKENLEALSMQEHKARHGGMPGVNRIGTSVVKSIVFLREEEVYDLVMQGPEHNFIANGFVAHNCDQFGGCPYRGICSRTPGAREQWLKSDFDYAQWNPLQIRGDI